MTSQFHLFQLKEFFSSHFKRYSLHLIIFFTALFFIITISNPATFFNDEWITLNQLRQMDNGQQMIFNEGTYGVWKNGTSTPYFDVKERYLGYTLMLPVLSWPMLKFFSFFGDNFRLPVLYFWALLPIIAIVLLTRYHPEYSRLWGLPWNWIVFTIMAGFLIFNLIFYYPFPFFGNTVPREIAAVVFTQHILFAIFSVVIFSIIFLYSKNTWYSLFGLIICLGCSSYIFWASNAKDHLLTVTILAISLFFLMRYTMDGNHLDGVSGFIAIGLLSWARPEFALVMFILSAAFIVLLNIYTLKKETPHLFPFKTWNLFVPLATLIGALPFFLNNFYVNKNPFIPTFLSYLTKNEIKNLSFNIASPHSGGELIQQMDIIGMINPIFYKVVSYFSIKSTDFPRDLFSILFAPENGAISIIAVVPVLLILLIMLVYLIYSQKRKFFSPVPWVLLYLIILLIGLPLAYVGGIHGLNTSLGITPDIRYLSPIYLVISLLGIFLIYQLYSDIDWKKISIMIICIIGIAVPINLYMLLTIFTEGASAPEYIRFYNVFSILMACIAAFSFIFSLKSEKFKDFFVIFLGTIAISPLSWQILMTYFFASAKFNGYPFWIPMMEIIYNRLIFVY